MAFLKVPEAASRRSFTSRSLDTPISRICMELEFLLVLSTFDRDLYRDESHGLHWMVLCGYCSIMHA